MSGNLASGMYDTSLVCRKVQASAHRGSIVARLGRSPPEPLRGAEPGEQNLACKGTTLKCAYVIPRVS